MIREDPSRPGVFIVDVSKELVAELRSEWSPPVQHRIEKLANGDEMLVMRGMIRVPDEGGVDHYFIPGTELLGSNGDAIELIAEALRAEEQ